MTELYERALDQCADDLRALVAFRVTSILKNSGVALDSPLERAMLAGLVSMQMVEHLIRFEGDKWVLPPPDGPIISVKMQHQIDRYRVDFAVRVGKGSEVFGQFVVECDGHNFHERTPEQATRDRSGDRALLALGWPTLRFTHREITGAATDCAAQVLEAALRHFPAKGKPPTEEPPEQ